MDDCSAKLKAVDDFFKLHGTQIAAMNSMKSATGQGFEHI